MTAEPPSSTSLKSGPRVTTGRGSKQDYQTPWEFIRAVESRFGKFEWDLAADDQNHKAPKYFTEKTNSLSHPWAMISGNCWLNPPFGVIGPWAEKCAKEARLGAKIFLLTPASVGSNWFAEHVHGKALVLFLSPRLTFDGADDPYPKDLILSCYGQPPGYEPWRWKL